MNGWYPVILSDGTRGYISAQFVVWQKPYDPPVRTTTTKKYIYVSKSGYPKSGWAGNQLRQTQKLKLKSSPKSSGNTVRSAPYATKGVVRGKTSNGYYISGGNGYQIVYGYGEHVQFTKPFIKYGVLSSNDKQIISKSNASVGSGCCGGGGSGGNGSGGGSGNDVSSKIPNGTTPKTKDSVDVEDLTDDQKIFIATVAAEGLWRADGKPVNVNARNTYTEARVHQASLGAGGGWSIVCITVQGRSRYGIDEMNAFSKLVGNEATLIVER